jgi:hypothetical protein
MTLLTARSDAHTHSRSRNGVLQGGARCWNGSMQP